MATSESIVRSVTAMNLALGAVYLLATLASARRARRDLRARAGWTCFTIGCAGNVLAQVGLVLASRWPTVVDPGGSLGNWLGVGIAPVLGMALLLWPGAPTVVGAGVRLLLDGVIFAGASLFVVWTLFLDDLRVASDSSSSFGFAIASIVIAAGFLAVGILLVARDAGRLRGPVGVYLGCLVTSIGADLASATVFDRSVFFTGHVVDVLQAVPVLLLGAVPFAPGQLAGRPWRDDHHASLLATYLPYVPFAGAVVTAIAGSGLAWDPVRAVTALVVLTALVVRQALAVHDLRRTSIDLDDRVRSRTRALEESQAALVHGQRLEAVGQMAAGVAHDFNNLIMIVKGSTDYVRQTAAADQVEVLDEIDEAANRASNLVKQLLAFARQQPLEPKVFDVAAALRQVEPLLRRLLGSRHQLELDVADQALPVQADPGQFDQVFTNLVANARDAMVEPGTVTIRAFARGDQVCVVVRDTGNGIPPAVMARIFEPFFTTKQALGTGLGLSTVFGIVKQNHGTIDVHSEPGQGATFEISWPRHAAVGELGAAVRPAAVAASLAAAGPRVFYVDDEEALVRLVVRQLEQRGHRVTGFTEAAAALEALIRDPSACDLLVCDQRMPGMSGLDLARAVRARPAPPAVLLISGWVADDLRAAVADLDQVALLVKPATVDELVAAIERCGGAPSSR